MSGSNSDIYITKIAAADRQLRAAIRMFFYREDDLAIHTLGSAAYQIVNDLKQHRGRDEVGDLYRRGIFYLVLDYQRGTLPAAVAKNPETVKWVAEMAKKLQIDENSKIEDLEAEASRSLIREFWKKQNLASNYLKHANRDPETPLDLKEIDNVALLSQLATAYNELVPQAISNESLVLFSYVSALHGMDQSLPEDVAWVAEQLQGLNDDDRLVLCSRLIAEMNQNGV